jgi:uncharacterized membrane protein
MRPRIKKLFSAAQIENSMGLVMLFGALISAAIVLLGGGIYLRQDGKLPANYKIYHGAPADLCSLHGIMQGVYHFSGPATIQIGLLLLVAVQLLRIVLTELLFLLGRDWFFVLVTTVVLGILLYSLFVQ